MKTEDMMKNVSEMAAQAHTLYLQANTFRWKWTMDTKPGNLTAETLADLRVKLRSAEEALYAVQNKLADARDQLERDLTR